MIKRITISIAAAALFAVPAQSASAALSKPVGPVAQEMDHGIVQPTVNQGVSSSPGMPEDGAVESSQAISADQGVSTSPGTAEPVLPEQPGYEATDGDGTEEEDTPEGDCFDAVDATEKAKSWLRLNAQLFQVFSGNVGQLFYDQGMFALDVIEDLEEQEKKACSSGPEGETAQ